MLQYIYIPVIAGIIGTSGITAFLWAIDKSGWANADMVRAVGSLFTKAYENALRVGLMVHFTAGIIISAIYLHFLSILNLPGFLSLIFIGGVIGFVHGFVFSFVMVIMSEHHPVEKFRQTDFQVALAHILGHVIYGGLIGVTFAGFKLMGFNLNPPI
jgi:hypothetical protein